MDLTNFKGRNMDLTNFKDKDMNLTNFKERLEKYLTEISSTNVEASKAFLFLELVRDVFKDVEVGNPHKLFPDLEKSIKSEKTVLIKGRVDAILGNLIIEFEKNLSQAKIEESEEQLTRYTTILWNKYEVIDYVLLATDGIDFRIYFPRTNKDQNFVENDIRLELISQMKFRIEEYELVYRWLTRFILFKSKISPIPNEIIFDFGPNSILYKKVYKLLQAAWGRVASDFSSQYNEWAKYLSIVYGDSADSDELFLRHTYLATLAKLMVYAYYSNGILPSSTKEIDDLLSGAIFKKWGIDNFLEEDFFSWLVHSDISKIKNDIVFAIIEILENFDLNKINQDLLKELYQDLVDPKERHPIGEYYTPDWLAELIIKKLDIQADERVLDPACGSGTFLVSAIKQKIKKRNGIKNDADLRRTINKVMGIDIHPLAVLISKANYLIALGKGITKKTAPISVPVYMADSILSPKPKPDVLFGEDVFVYEINPDVSLINPQEIIKIGKRDEIIDRVKERSIELVSKQKPENTIFISQLKKEFGLSQKAATILSNTAESLAQLIRQKQDHIYAYILKNIYVPSIIHKFEVITGNPPWLTYKDIKDIKRQNEIRNLVINDFSLLDPNETKEITNMEEASLFFVKCVETFLIKNGRIGFVMPRSIFSGEQHSNFRKSLFKNIKIKFTEIIDLDKIKPLFNMPSCVLFGKRDDENRYPVPAIEYSGNLKQRNLTFEKFQYKEKDETVKKSKTKLKLIYLGKRNAWASESLEICKGRETIPNQSKYMDLFAKGGDLYPRPFWFVDFEIHDKFGITDNKPALKTSTKVSENPNTKEQYRNVKLFGNVEKEFIFSTLLGIDILPFCYLPPQPLVLPIKPSGNVFEILNSEDAKKENFVGLSSWLEKVEDHWMKIRGTKSSKYDVYKSLNHYNKLTNQDSNSKFGVVFGTSGTYLTSTAIDLKKTLNLKLGDAKFKLSKFIFEHSTYYYCTKTFDETKYLASILNSTVLDTMIKPFQSRGLGGPRTIHTRPLEAPIPIFNPKNKLHNKLVELFDQCENKATDFLKQKNYINQDSKVIISNTKAGIIRSEIRKSLANEIKMIDELVCELLTNPKKS